jgi:sirohydrochlorin cobaltochelatase
VTDKTAIVLVGHGSLMTDTGRFYEDIAARVMARTGRHTEVGYLQGQVPTIKETVEDVAGKGFKRIAVVPLFVVPGSHVTEDIPIILGLKEGETDLGYGTVEVPQDVEIVYGKHLGADDALVELVLKRVREVLG